MTAEDNHLIVEDMSVIRGTCLLGFSRLVADRGADPAPILRAAGVAPEEEGNDDVFITYRSLALALNAAVRATGDTDLGRRLALRQGIDIFGAVGLAARTAPTVGAALEVFAVYLRAYGPAVEVELLPQATPERTLLEFRVVAEDMPPMAQVVELSLGLALQVLRFLTGSDYRPVRVRLPHDPLAEEEEYTEYFGCRTSFAQRCAGLELRTGDLSRPLTRDAIAHHAVVRYLDSIVPDRTNGMTAPVRQLVRQLLPTGAVGARLVADQFALHPKTLQRRLAAEGTSFQALVDEVRAELAVRYLRETDMSIALLARELGYSEQSVLTRSCQRWFGRGPTSQRAFLRGAGAPGAE